jgi:hypothetical protein
MNIFNFVMFYDQVGYVVIFFSYINFFNVDQIMLKVCSTMHNFNVHF